MNKQSSKYLDIYCNGTENRSKVQQYYFINGCLTEQWKVTYVGNGDYRLQVMHANNMYLDATANPGNNSWMEIYEYYVCDEQLWKITPNGDGSFRLSTKKTDTPCI